MSNHSARRTGAGRGRQRNRLLRFLPFRRHERERGGDGAVVGTPVSDGDGEGAGDSVGISVGASVEDEQPTGAMTERLAAMEEENARLRTENSILTGKFFTSRREISLLTGKFFASIEAVWSPKEADFRGYFDSLRRPEGYFEEVPSYKKIVEGVREPLRNGSRLVPRVSSKSASSNSGSNKKKKNFCGTNGREVGHELPDSKTCAPTYGISAQLPLGFDVEKFCVTLGKEKETTIQALQHVVCGNDEDRTYGLRSIPLNHLMVPPNHATYYDDAPEWIIVPIMSVDQIKQWLPGQDYWVMVLASGPEAYKALVTEDFNDEEPGGVRGKCSKEDIDKATELLSDHIKANADALLGRPNPVDGTPTSIVTPFDLFERSDNAEVKKKRGQLNNTKTMLERNYRVKTPVMNDFNEDWNILKVHLNGSHDVNIPDPSTIALKASINCSQLYSQKLLPACPTVVEEEEDILDALAREFYERAELERVFGGGELTVEVDDVEDELSDDEELRIVTP